MNEHDEPQVDPNDDLTTGGDDPRTGGPGLVRPVVPDWSRRNFIRSSAAVVAAGALPAIAHARKDPDLRIGLIGCGGRGTGAVHNALEANPRARLTALADVFPDRLEDCRQRLAGLGTNAEVPDRRCFTGFDAYRAVVESDDVDVVILATPPHFRPAHFAAAVDAGRHVFIEKPVAVDPAGVRTMIAAAARAERKGLSVVAGTQRRHEASYLDAIARIRAGAIGRPVAARCSWNMGGLWVEPRRPEWSGMEWQLRNWLYFTWLSGDHIVEQHVHNLDVVNWAFDAHPVSALAVGGRQARTHPDYGHIFDHFAVEYDYGDGRFALSMCRQMDGCPGRVEEIVSGTTGHATLRPGFALIESDTPWRFDAPNPNPYVEEHRALFASIDGSGPHLNEARRVAESTLTAIMGRMAAYTGQVVSWEQALESTLDLAPPAYVFGELPVPEIAVPGRTRLV